MLMSNDVCLQIPLATQVALARQEAETCRRLMAEDMTGRQEAYRQVLAVKDAIVLSLEWLSSVQQSALEELPL
jgi:hypothetical protein